MYKIIVTGAQGFIGRHLVQALNKAGYEVFEADVNDGDIEEESTWLRFPDAEVVIQLAGKSFVPDSWINPFSFIKCNLLGVVHALDYCKKHHAKLIFLSSYIYGDPETLPILETNYLKATNPYALSKKMAEEVCEFYHKCFGINVTILRPFNVYGPGQPTIFLVPSIINQVIAGKEIKVKDLEPKRDYIYISDLVDAIIRAIIPSKGFNILNIGSGKSYSVAELIRIIQEIKNSELKVVSANERRTNEVMETVADISRAFKVIGWEPKIELKIGIQLICDSLK